MSRTLQAHLALLAANIIYGVNYSIAKLAMPSYIKPFGFILLRASGAMVLFWIVSGLFIREKVDKKDIPRLAILGFFGVALNQMLFFKGLSMTTPSNAAIIMVSNPIITIILASLFLRERLSSFKLIGVLLGAAGVVLLLSDHKFSFGSDTFVGDLLVLINSTSWAVYLILVKPLMMKYNTFTIVKWVFLFGFIYVLPFSYNEFTEVNWSELPHKIWWAILFVVIATTFIAYILNTYALRALSPAVVSAYIYLQPFLAALFALYVVPLFDPTAQLDSITVPKVISALLIFTGVYLVSKPAATLKE
jgi:drug/metabolite transporter (DMT)-like permease